MDSRGRCPLPFLPYPRVCGAEASLAQRRQLSIHLRGEEESRAHLELVRLAWGLFEGLCGSVLRISTDHLAPVTFFFLPSDMGTIVHSRIWERYRQKTELTNG